MFRNPTEIWGQSCVNEKQDGDQLRKHFDELKSFGIKSISLFSIKNSILWRNETSFVNKSVKRFFEQKILFSASVFRQLIRESLVKHSPSFLLNHIYNGVCSMFKKFFLMILVKVWNDLWIERVFVTFKISVILTKEQFSMKIRSFIITHLMFYSTNKWIIKKFLLINSLNQM